MVECPSCGESNVGDAVFCAYCGTALTSTASKERRFLTILFADLVGFTAESDEADPEDVQARLIPYHRRVREEIERYDGTVEKLIGDGVMAVFGAPTAHEDDPERAVRVALRIQAAVDELNDDQGLDLSVRIGINSGEAVVSDGSEGERIVGDVVNTASRLESIAPPGGVVVGETTHRATELLIEYEDLPPVEVKGKSKPLAVWRAIEPRGRYGIDAAVRTATPFLGRDREMHLLTETFNRVLDDESAQLVTVSAPAGVGKSRLVNEFWQWVDDRPEIVWWRQGRNLPYGEGITFWALGEIVKGQAGIRESDSPNEAAEKLSTALEALTTDPADRDWLVTQLGPLVGLGSEAQLGDRAEAFTAWRRFLEDLAAVQPLIMVIEDLHWADEALVEFLRDLLVWSTDAAIMVICTTRPELYEAHPGWGGGQRNSTTLSLSPLTDDDIAKLLSSLLDQAVMPAETQRMLLDRAGGNPLYAEEFVRMLIDRGMLQGRGQLDEVSEEAIPVPETVQALIGSRLDILSDDESTVIQDASVVGKVFWEGAIGAMADRAEVRAALRQLVEREWVRPVRSSSVEGEREYAFWHALTRDVAYGRIPRQERSTKHRTVAEWIEATAGERASDHAELLAHHYLSALEIAEAAGAGDMLALREQATRTLVMAGDRAMRLDAGRALRYYEQALELMGPVHPARAEVLVLAGQAMRDHVGLAPTVELYREAAELAEANGDQMTLGHAQLLTSEAQWFEGGVGAGKDTLDRAIATLESEPPSEHLAKAFLLQASYSMLQGDLDAQHQWAERGIALADQLGLEELKGRGLSLRGIARFDAGDIEGGMADLDESVVIANAGSTSGFLLLNAYINLADYTRWAIGPGPAQEVYERGIELAEGRGGRWAWASAETMWTLFDLGRWDEVLATGGDLVEGREEGMQIRAWAQSNQALVSAWRGELAQAATLQAEYLAGLREVGDPQQLAPGLIIAAKTELAQGNVEEAVSLLDEFMAITEGKSPAFRQRQFTEAVRLLVAVGEVDKARDLTASVTSPALRIRLNVATAGAVIDEATGNTKQALEEYEQLAQDWADYGHVLEHALALYGTGRCLAAVGRPDEAADRLADAREIFVELGATPTVEEIDGAADEAAAL